MRIAINIRSFTNRGGIGQYARSLVKNLVILFPNHHFLLFGIRGTDTSFLPETKNWQYYPVHGPSNRLMWERFALTQSVNDENPDIYHNPDYTAPPGIISPIVVTVHDLSFKYFPDGLSFKAKILYNLTVPRSIERATLAIADSHFTKSEIKRAGWKNVNDIRVVHLGVDEIFFNTIADEEMESVLKQHNLQRGYILYLGALDKRKNIISILHAYSKLKNEGVKIPKLVLAGEDIGGGAQLTNEILKLRLGNDVLRIGFISHEHIRHIYKGASMFVFPSHYEGFGLPPLEAMACGVPVITSDSASLPEVVGDAGFMVPVGHIPPLAEAMRIFITDNKIHEEYSLKAKERAKNFTWQKTAKETMEVYLEAVNKQKRTVNQNRK